MAAILDAVKSMQVANNQRKSREQKQAEYDSVRNASTAIGAVGLATPPGMASLALTGMGLINDSRMAEMEKENPSLATGLGPQRYSTVGQILGFGYPNQVGIPKVGVFDRLRNVFTGGDGLPDPRTNMWNARGSRITILDPGVGAPVTSGGWETGDGGGDGPSAAQGTSNFGGRESAVGQEDRSGYA